MFGIVIQEQLESVIYINSYADGGIRDVVFSPDGKYMFATGFDVSCCCFKFRYDATVCILHSDSMNNMVTCCQTCIIVFGFKKSRKVS